MRFLIPTLALVALCFAAPVQAADVPSCAGGMCFLADAPKVATVEAPPLPASPRVATVRDCRIVAPVRKAVRGVAKVQPVRRAVRGVARIRPVRRIVARLPVIRRIARR